MSNTQLLINQLQDLLTRGSLSTAHCKQLTKSLGLKRPAVDWLIVVYCSSVIFASGQIPFWTCACMGKLTNLLHLEVDTPQSEVAGRLLTDQMRIFSEVITTAVGTGRCSWNHVHMYRLHACMLRALCYVFPRSTDSNGPNCVSD